MPMDWASWVKMWTGCIFLLRKILTLPKSSSWLYLMLTIDWWIKKWIYMYWKAVSCSYMNEFEQVTEIDLILLCIRQNSSYHCTSSNSHQTISTLICKTDYKVYNIRVGYIFNHIFTPISCKEKAVKSSVRCQTVTFTSYILTLAEP